MSDDLGDLEPRNERETQIWLEGHRCGEEEVLRAASEDGESWRAYRAFWVAYNENKQRE